MSADHDRGARTHLVPGVIDSEGRIHPVPTVVTIGADGKILSQHPLTGHEPAFTTPLDALLHLPTLTLRPLAMNGGGE